MSFNLESVLPSGRYTELSLLCSGGSSVIYSAVDSRRLGRRHVVIKAVREGLPEEARGAFHREVRVAGDLEGVRHLPKVWAVGPEASSFAYMAMSPGGCPLDPAQPMSLSTVLQIGISLSETLEDVHRCGYVLDNVCPANVLVDPDLPDPVMPVDLGSACRLSEVDSGVDAPIDPDAVEYAAPERRAGGCPSVAADIYSVGAVLCSLLTGGAPSSGEPSAQEATSSLHSALLRVVRKATAAAPDGRYTSATELREALERIRAAYELDQTTQLLAPVQVQEEAPGLIVQPRFLDFGEVRAPTDKVTRTFELRSLDAVEVELVSSRPWLRPEPEELMVSEDAVTAAVTLSAEPLCQGQEHRGWVEVRPAGNRPVLVECRVRYTGGLDLVLLLDTIGDEERLCFRCDFVEALLASLAREENLGSLRVALLAYGDHEAGDYIHPLGLHRLRRTDFADVDSIVQALDALTPVASHDFESSAEVALGELQGLPWRPLSAHILVAVGHRPPHPLGVDTFDQSASPTGQDWRELWDAARGRHKLRGLSLVDESSWLGRRLEHAEEYTRGFWSELGDLGTKDLRTTSPRDAAQLLVAGIRGR